MDNLFCSAVLCWAQCLNLFAILWEQTVRQSALIVMASPAQYKNAAVLLNARVCVCVLNKCRQLLFVPKKIQNLLPFVTVI